MVGSRRGMAVGSSWSGGGGEVVRVECGVGVLVASLCACGDEREAQCWVILAPAHPGSDP